MRRNVHLYFVIKSI